MTAAGLAPTFAIKCPRCSERAEAIMKPSGTRGSYREVYVDFRVERIICSHCHLAKIAGSEPVPYELWYRTNFKGHTLWAKNEAHIDSLIEWLSSGRSFTGTSYEALPHWIVTDRPKVIEALRKMKARG